MPALIELPEECVLAVFNWLPLSGLVACSAVSRELYRLAKDPSLWKGLFIESKFAAGDGVPDPRLWCSSVAFKGKLYVFGGHTTQGVLSNLISNVKSDFFAYDNATRKWSQLQHSMNGKTEHKCVIYNNRLWFVGGYNGYDYTSDIHVYDPDSGECSVIETTGDAFSRRSALTALVWKNKMYTFGGWNGFSRTWYNDLHVFNFDSKVWRAIAPTGKMPAKRTSHSAVIFNGKMYVFGGFSGDEYLNDLHEFDLETETWTEVSHLCKGDIPAPRSRFCAAVHGNCMYILGGWNKVGYFNDFYQYNFLTRVWTNISNNNFAIPCISQYSLSADEDFLYIFGGFCAQEKACINKLFRYRVDDTSTQAS